MAELDQWMSKKSIIVTTLAEATVIPNGDLKDYLQNTAGRNTEVTLKYTKNGKEIFVQFDSESAAQKVLKETWHKVSQPNGRVYEFSVKSCTAIQERKYLKADGTSAGSTATSSSPSEVDGATSKNSILVTSAVEAAVIPKCDLENYLQSIVGRNTEVTLEDTDNDKETIVQFDSENAAQKVLDKTRHKETNSNGRMYEFSVKSCPTIQEKKYLKADGTSAGSTATSSSPSDAVQKVLSHKVTQQNSTVYEVSLNGCVQEKKYFMADGTSAGSTATSSTPSDAATEVHSKPAVELPDIKVKVSSVEDTSTAENEWDGKTIKVCGLQPATSDHVIKSFFQNKNLSSGGEIKTFDIDRNNGVAYVTFVTAGVAQTVLKKPDLNLEGGVLDASRAWDKARRQEESDRQDKSCRPEESDRQGKSRKLEESNRQDKSCRLEESDRQDKPRRPVESDRQDKSCSPEKSDRQVKSHRLEESERHDKSCRPVESDRQNKSHKLEESDRQDKSCRPEESDRQDKSCRPAESDRQDKSRRLEESDRQDKSCRPEESDRQDKSRRPEESDRQDKSRRPEESDRQDKSRSPEKSDRQDKSRRQEEFDRQDKSQRLEESLEAERSSQEEWDGRTIVVYGFDPSATGDAIVLLFESKFPSDDVTVRSVQRSPGKNVTSGKNVTYLTFESAEVTKKALSVKAFSLDGTTVTVQPARGVKPESLVSVPVSCHPSQDSKSAEKVSSKQNHSDKGASLTGQPKQPHPTHQEKRPVEQDVSETRLQNWDQRTIEVRNVRPNTPKEAFIRCFQDKNLCRHGGKVKEVDTSNQSRGVVFVKFREPGVASSVLSQKSMRMDDGIVDVAPYLSKTPVGASAQLTTADARSTHAVDARSTHAVDARSTHAVDARSTYAVDAHHDKSSTHTSTVLAPQPSASAQITDETANKQKYMGGATSHHNVDNKDTPISIGQLKIEIVQGDLTKEQTDAIVNSSNGSLDLTQGAISQAIAKAGGRSLVKKCKKHGTIPSGGIAVTEAGKLPCDRIIHINAERNTRWPIIINNVLVEAEQLRIKSVSFPALGTGIHGLKPCDAANNMLEAIISFTQTNIKYLKLVRIVIFEQKMKESFKESLEKVASPPVFSSSHRTNTGARSKHTPQSSTSAQHHDDGQKTYEVASTKVHVHEGDITKMNVDVIVNAANGRLDHGGGVAEAIARAAGPEFTQECHRIIQERGEIDDGDGVMTSSGQLPCRKVYHVVGPVWHDYKNMNDCLRILHQAFTSCLMASKDYSSIAIPAVSSGIYGVPSELVAQTMFEAVTKFCHSEAHQLRLRDIHLVDINTAMVKLIQESFKQQSSTSEENSQKSALPSSRDPRRDQCPICLEMMVKPKILPICKHKFCEACINKCFDQKRECPVCRTVYGMLQGNQPKSGTMHSTICSTVLPSYSCRTIVIEYSFPDGTQTREHPHPGQPFYGTHRTAYLPENKDGRRILDLLKRAFGQRLTFTVGRSVTSGQDDCVTWNDIHHKTSQYGGPDRYGYPDQGYLQRVKEDLAAKGIK